MIIIKRIIDDEPDESLPVSVKSNALRLKLAAIFLLIVDVAAVGYGFFQTLQAKAQIQTIVEFNWSTASSTPMNRSLTQHQSTPNEVRGIYLTGMSFGSNRLEELLAYAEKNNLNAMVIDVKLDNGGLIFEPHDEKLKPYVSDFFVVDDMDALLEKLKEKGIYRIARIFVMRDTVYGERHPASTLQNISGGVWRDRAGTPWLDPASPQVTAYAIDLAREAYARGFDEVQFDYVRFPTDGRLSEIKYPVYDGETAEDEVMRTMFDNINRAMEENRIPYSYDFYGMTCWRSDDFGIGQRIADVYPSGTAVSPMLYPSHFPDHFKGYANPAEYPYEIVKLSLDEAVKVLHVDHPELDEQAARKWQRPWIQDFDIGAVYGSAEVHAQVKAARDAGASGFLIWNARNVYSLLEKPL